MRKLLALPLAAATLALVVAAGAPATVDNPWTGKWSRPSSEVGGFQGGVTTLEQTGATVTGSFNWNGGGSIVGDVSGSTLTGEWSQPSYGSGTFALTLSSDAKSFSGEWKTRDGSASGPWHGTLIGVRTERAKKRYKFSVSLKAEPYRGTRGDLPGYVQSLVTGGGSLSGSGDPADLEFEAAGAQGKFELRRQYLHFKDEGIVLGVLRATSFQAGSRVRALRLDVVVISSNAPDCPRKTSGKVVLQDGRDPDLGDGVALMVCGWRSLFRNEPAKQNLVDVKISG